LESKVDFRLTSELENALPQLAAIQALYCVPRARVPWRPEIQNEMKTICELLSLRRSDRSAIGIQTTSIARNCCDLRMLPEPICQTFRTAVRQQVDYAMKVQIDEYRFIG